VVRRSALTSRRFTSQPQIAVGTLRWVPFTLLRQPTSPLKVCHHRTCRGTCSLEAALMRPPSRTLEVYVD